MARRPSSSLMCRGRAFAVGGDGALIDFLPHAIDAAPETTERPLAGPRPAIPAPTTGFLLAYNGTGRPAARNRPPTQRSGRWCIPEAPGSPFQPRHDLSTRVPREPAQPPGLGHARRATARP